jgi:hypothetical protein
MLAPFAVKGVGLFLPVPIDDGMLFQFNPSTGPSPPGMLLYEASSENSRLREEVRQSDLAGEDLMRRVTSLEGCLKRNTKSLCELCAAVFPRLGADRTNYGKLCDLVTAAEEMRYIDTLLVSAKKELERQAICNAEVVRKGSAMLLAARRLKAKRHRMNYGSYRWRKNRKNADRHRFIKPNAPPEVADAAFGIWQAIKCDKRHGPSELQVRSTLDELNRLAYGGTYFSQDLYKHFQRVFKFSAVRLARCSDMSTHGCSLSTMREIRLHSPDYKKYGRGIFPSASAIGAKMRILSKLGREKLGLVVSNGGLTMSCDYAKVICTLAHQFKWVDIEGQEANRVLIKVRWPFVWGCTHSTSHTGKHGRASHSC